MRCPDRSPISYHFQYECPSEQCTVFTACSHSAVDSWTQCFSISNSTNYIFMLFVSLQHNVYLRINSKNWQAHCQTIRNSELWVVFSSVPSTTGQQIQDVLFSCLGIYHFVSVHLEESFCLISFSSDCARVSVAHGYDSDT